MSGIGMTNARLTRRSDNFSGRALPYYFNSDEGKMMPGSTELIKF